jgi:glycosyltransferase involved in cell wall biosynthesis
MMSDLELSIVMPCLNEADTVAVCVEKAMRTIREHNIAGEVIVADNGSTDGSQDIATKLGARVVPVEAKGYGSALMGASRRREGSSSSWAMRMTATIFSKSPSLSPNCVKASTSYKAVDCRRRWNSRRRRDAVLASLDRKSRADVARAPLVRGAPINDVYCGMRGFTKHWYEKLNQRCTGMEFATEMIIKSSRYRAKMAEVPITLHPDGRKGAQAAPQNFPRRLADAAVVF